RRRRAVAVQSAACVRVPPALSPVPAGPLRRRDAEAPSLRTRPRGRLSLPGGALADDRGGAPAPICGIRAGGVELVGELTDASGRRQRGKHGALVEDNDLRTGGAMD